VRAPLAEVPRQRRRDPLADDDRRSVAAAAVGRAAAALPAGRAHGGARRAPRSPAISSRRDAGLLPRSAGQNARLFARGTAIKGRIRNIVGQRIAITLGSTAGYNGARAINADTDLLKANTDYAVLGMTTDTECAAICLRGPDTGNLRVSVPGEPSLVHHVELLVQAAEPGRYNLPLIPIINSANKGGTLIDCVNDENGGTANVTIWLASSARSATAGPLFQ
jgi:hypothetical protein